MTTHLACFQSSAVPIIKLSSRKTHYRSELSDLRNEVEGKKKNRRGKGKGLKMRKKREKRKESKACFGKKKKRKKIKR